MQAAAPTLPFVGGVRRLVENTVDAGFFEGGDVYFGITAETSAANTVGAEFTAAVADEYQFDFLFECSHVGDVCHCNAATTENANV